MARSQKIKLVFLLLLSMSAIVAAIIALIPFLISTDAIRLRLARDLSTWTGYNVQLRGAPHISIFPSLQASLSDVTLSDATDNSAPLMDARRVEVDLSLYDALMGRVRFSETRIISPRITIDEPVKTVAGFFASLARSEGTLGIAIREARSIVEQNPENPDSSQLLAQPFGRILIEDGTLVYPGSDNGAESEITHIKAVIDWPESTRSAALKASGRWHGALTNLTLNAEQALLLMGGGPSPLRVSVNSNRGGITFTGTARFAQNFVLNGHIASRSPGWNHSMAWIGGAGFFGANVTAPLVWESTLNAQSGHIELNDIVFTLGDNSARGALEIAFQNNRPVTTGSIAFDTLDLDQIVPALFPDDKTTADLSFLDRFGLDLRLSTSKAVIRGIAMSNLAASIQIRHGRLVFDIGNAQIFGGTAQTTVQLQRNKQALIEVESRLSASNLNLEQLQQALGINPVFKANGNTIVTLQSGFSQWGQFLPNARGNLSFDFGQGTLSDYDINGFMQRVRAADTFTLETARNAAFKFDKVQGKAAIESGHITVDFVTMRAGEHSIDIYGGIHCLDNKLQLTGAVDRPRTIDGICYNTQCIAQSLLPIAQFAIDGPWPNATVSPLVQ